jgi:hypothetical protein
VNGLPVPAAEAVNLRREKDSVEVSVLVLVTYRAEPLAELYEEIVAGVRGACDGFEFVFVVEPPFLDSTPPLTRLATQGEPICVLTVGQELGETALLRAGVPHCRGSIVLTVPSYRRVEAAGIARLIDAVRTGVDLAVARRWPRRDSWLSRTHTRVFHALAARVVGRTTQRINDVACGVRALRPTLLEQIPLYGDFALFLPFLALHDGYSVKEVPLPQHRADRQTKRHPPGLYLRRAFDLLGLFFLLRFTEKPLRFFGSVGAVFVLPGAVILGVLLVQRLGGTGIANRPLLLLGVLLVVLGIQAIALGLIGEIIVHLHAAQRPMYRLRHETSSDPAGDSLARPRRGGT